MIFDGAVSVHSTCQDCKQQMQVIEAGETVHPTCTPKPTKLETLAQGWLSAVLHDDTEAEQLTEAEIVKLDAEPPNLKRYAIGYARMGWPVFPLRGFDTKCNGGDRCATECECPKKPLRGTNGLHDATTDVSRVTKWWTDHPTHNIGIATGHLFDVFDIDTQSGGLPSLLKLLDQRRVPETHGIVVAARGGMHLYLEPKGIGNKAGFMPGLDYRGMGGYVVAPPSTLGRPERSWSWLVLPSPAIKVAA